MAETLHLVPQGAQGAQRATHGHASLFLRALPQHSFDRLAPEIETVEMRAKVVLWEPDTPIRSVYFPHTCVMSIIIPLRGDVAVEAGTVGREGFLGVPVLLGGDSTSSQAICQISGMTSRLPASVFRRAIADDPELRDFCLRYAQALLEQTSQSVACNGRHDLSERCARWLLMTADRVVGEEFHLTHEFLATMLGVRRATVTVAAAILQRAGLIKYSRGRVRILNREGLEEASCECYEVVRRKFENLVGISAG
jgi:CRP-like cAMP-binding protein